MYIDSLILEVTRRCNLKCAHCLRGEAQNLDISNETIKALIDSVDGIGNVTFTGGEPALNLPAIEYFFEYAATQGKLPYSFYIVTNGTVNSEPLAMLTLKWWPLMEERDYCGVAISVDEYHEQWEDPDNSILHGLVYYRKDKEQPDLHRYLIAEGRSENNPAARPLPDYELDTPEVDEDGSIEQLYVAANGKLFVSCDASFEHVDADAVYTVADLKDLAKKAVA